MRSQAVGVLCVHERRNVKPNAPSGRRKLSETPTHGAPAAPAPSPTWAAAAATGLLYLVLWQVAPRIRWESHVPTVISTLGSVTLALLFGAYLARSASSARVALWLTGVATLCAVPLRLGAAFGAMPQPWRLMAGVPGLPDLCVVALAAGLGVQLSRLLRAPNLILPVAVVLALTDIWTVMLNGPVQRIMQSQTEAAQRVTAAMMVGLPPKELQTGAAPMAGAGFADFLFVAFFVACITRFAPADALFRSTVKWVVGVLSLYVLVVMFSGLALPALVPIAVTVIVLHRRLFTYTRAELFAMIYALLLLAAVIGGMWMLSRPGPAAPRPAGERTGATTG